MGNQINKLNQSAPQSGRAINDKGTLFNWLDQIVNGFDPFNSLRVAEDTPQFVWKSVFPVSNLRDKITEDNGATVANIGSEIKIETSATAGSIGEMQTMQRGDYIPGSIFIPGKGVRIPELPTSAVAEWGYFDHNNGAFFRLDRDNLSVVQRRAGVETVIPQAEWNIDNLTGTGGEKNPSGVSLDLSQGHVFRFPFLYYGYGYLRFEIGIFDESGTIHRVIPVHTFSVEFETALTESNLPLTSRVEGNGETFVMYVGGRQMSVSGKDNKTFRDVGAVRKEVTVNSTDWYPMLSVRQKTDRGNIFVQKASITVLANGNTEVGVFRNASLTGASFASPANYDANETATEWDNSATAMTGGNLISGPKLVSGTRGESGFTSQDLPDLPILNGDVATYAVRRISATGSHEVTLSAGVKENW